MRRQGDSTRHVERSATIRLDGTPGEVFPLFGPIREMDWAEGWSPRVVHPGGDPIGEGAAFTHGTGDQETFWLMTTYDPDRGRVEYAVVFPGSRICRISIGMEGTDDRHTLATVRYAYTGLDAAGVRFVAGYSDVTHRKRIAAWEKAVNHYLKTGHRLREHHY